MEKKLPPEHEPIKYLELKDDDPKYEIYKNPEWDKTVPRILDVVDKFRDDKASGNYPYFRMQNAAQYLPKLDKPSEILNSPQLKELHSSLPYYHQYTDLKLVFSMSIDGCALKSFYNKCQEINNSVIVIKDEEGNVFGAYASEKFVPTSDFSGTGETYLFTYYKGNKINIYNSTGLNEHYMYCDNDQICFGCSDDYFSLVLRNNFLDGYSKKTQTYNNEPLNNNEKFNIIKLELWSFREK